MEERKTRLETQQEQMRTRMQTLDDEAAAKAKAEQERRDNYVPPKQVREGPPIGSRVSVYWSGDLKWSEGMVVEMAGTKEMPRYKVQPAAPQPGDANNLGVLLRLCAVAVG